mmetsp:Transcript_36378/g.113144  ORF Transcript_36378/g.113144 Transcript_36378/m.113144 type:complete len:316 (-) Transcript_36378:388-1335(-)
MTLQAASCTAAAGKQPNTDRHFAKSLLTSLAVRLRRPTDTRRMKANSTSCFLPSSRRRPAACSSSTNAALPPSSAGTGSALRSARFRLTVTKNMPRPTKRPSAEASCSPCWTMPTGPTTSPVPVPFTRLMSAWAWSPRSRATDSPAMPAASWKLAAFTSKRSLLLSMRTPRRCSRVSGSVKVMASSRSSWPPRRTSSSTGSPSGRPWMKSTVLCTEAPEKLTSRLPMRSSTSSRLRPVRAKASCPTSCTTMPGRGDFLGMPAVSETTQRLDQAVITFATTPPASTQRRAGADMASNSFTSSPPSSSTVFASLKRT